MIYEMKTLSWFLTILDVTIFVIGLVGLILPLSKFLDISVNDIFTAWLGGLKKRRAKTFYSETDAPKKLVQNTYYGFRNGLRKKEIRSENNRTKTYQFFSLALK